MEDMHNKKRAVVAYIEITNSSVDLILHDVESENINNFKTWNHLCLFTAKNYQLKQFIELKLSKEQYTEIGENLIMRLLALEGRLE